MAAFQPLGSFMDALLNRTGHSYLDNRRDSNFENTPDITSVSRNERDTQRKVYQRGTSPKRATVLKTMLLI